MNHYLLANGCVLFTEETLTPGDVRYYVVNPDCPAWGRVQAGPVDGAMILEVVQA